MSIPSYVVDRYALRAPIRRCRYCSKHIVFHSVLGTFVILDAARQEPTASPTHVRLELHAAHCPARRRTTPKPAPSPAPLAAHEDRQEELRQEPARPAQLDLW